MNGLGRNNEKKSNNQSIFTKETFGVVLMLFATLCLVCLITRDAVFSDPGEWVNSFLLGCFGYFAFAIQIALIWFGFSLISDKKINLNKKVKLFGTLFMVSLVALLNVVSLSGAVGEKMPAFGEYISTAYENAQEGVVGSTAGGAVMSFFTYFFSLILTDVGSYVVLSILMALCGYFTIKSFKKSTDKTERKTVFNSSYQKVSDVPPVTVSGEKEYPVSDVTYTEESEFGSQKLFVANEDTFAFKTKREMAKDGNNAGIKIGFEQNGLGVVNYGGSYSQDYSDDMKKRLEYIKTPVVIDVEKTVNTNYGSSTKISDYIPKTPVVNNTEKPVERNIATPSRIDIPCINHEEEKRAVFEANIATEHANKFGGYASMEEVKDVETVEEIKPASGAQEDIFRPTGITEKPVSSELSEETEQNSFGSVPTSERQSFYADIPEIDETEEKEEIKDVKEEPIQELPKVSPILSERRSRDIFHMDEEKPSFEEEKETPVEDNNVSFTSRVRADNNMSSRRAFDLTKDFDKVEEKAEEKSEEKPPKKEPPINREYFRPPLDLLETYAKPADAPKENHDERMEIITRTLEDFHISATPEGYVQGPSITRYEMKMPAGISVKKVLSYDEDIRMWLSSKHGVRIEAPIPGKNLVGVEVANAFPVTVGLREILEESAGEKAKSGSLMFAIGKDIVGKPILDNLAAGPHFLVAGATGSGKSVCLNVMIVSLIMRYSPEELRLCLIDPKGNEFRPYEHIPHLMIDEIVTEPKKALAVLSWAHDEMENRYKILENAGGIRDINSYNESRSSTERKMPRIVIIVDELSNLMETCKKEMEARILAIAQKARAVGIHLVLATQRPSVDVITGTIKANLPSRIALKVTNFADSNTILAEGGAEKLLGHGDMLYKNSGMAECERYQGAWISDREINNVVQYVIEHNEAYFDDDMTEYLEKAVHPKQEESEGMDNSDSDDGENNEFFKRALWLAVNTGTVSISQLQRRYSIGYARAGGLVDKMEQKGFVSKFDGSKARKVLLTREEFEARYGSMPDDY